MKRFAPTVTRSPIAAAIAVIMGAGLLVVPPFPVSADTRHGKLSSWTVTWDLDQEQTRKADALLQQTSARETQLEELMVQQRAQMNKLFLMPAPDRKAILTLQEKIESELEELRLIQLQFSLKVRAMLSPSQRSHLGFLKPDEMLTGIKLSPAQEEQFSAVIKPYLTASLSTAKKLAILNFEQSLFLQEMDLVHGCHAQKLDVPALLAKQVEINAVNRAMAMERLKLGIGVHRLLTLDQKRALSQSMAELQIPDPAEDAWVADASGKAAPIEEVYDEGVKPTAAQRAQYAAIMKRECAHSVQMKKVRDGLVAQLDKGFARVTLDEAGLRTLQQKISTLEDEAGLVRIKRIVAVRNVLTAEQRHTVYNRHHPKIWRDTGIDDKQDHQLMVLHMKIEEADREGRRKMIDLSQDVRRLYYENAPDDTIITAQKSFGRTEAEAIRKQLDCLFGGRDVLTAAQRDKLVQLMLSEDHF